MSCSPIRLFPQAGSMRVGRRSVPMASIPYLKRWVDEREMREFFKKGVHNQWMSAEEVS